MEKKLGIALAGLGEYASTQIVPAFQETKHCTLAGIITGDAEEAAQWQQQFNIPEQNVYGYENFDSIRDNPDIDIVYIMLPNAMHAEYVIRAARAGKHVLCEKPLAITVEECDRMLIACKQAGVLLSVGYRLHYEPYNREMMRLARERVFGDVRHIHAQHGMAGADGWRLDPALAGGGPLMDLGIYCIQAARYVTGLEPIAVKARELPKTKPEKYNKVEEALEWEMEFAGGIIAFCETSYEKEMNMLRVEASNGWFGLSPAFAYSGILGTSSAGKIELPEVNQQVLMLDGFAETILNNAPSRVSGETGYQDVMIMQAIYSSMRTGKRIELQ